MAQFLILNRDDLPFDGGAAQIVIVPKGVPHKFLNPGPGRLRQTDIHLGKRLQAEWLEEF